MCYVPVQNWAVGEGVSVLSGCTRQGSWGGGKCVKWLYNTGQLGRG